MKIKRSSRAYCAALMTGVVLSAGVMSATEAKAADADAAAPSDQAEDGGLGDIVVTANRREENLQSVPVAVTAFSAKDLEASQIVNLAAVARSTPSLNISKVQGDNTAVLLSMRGLGSTDVTATTDPAVGIYLDGVYIARAPGGNLEMVDVSRVEVLRGPQGTLFGRNTIGGAVNVVPNKPTDEWEGSISGAYGNYDYVRMVGVVNAPLGSAVALRVAASHMNQGGFAYDTRTGRDLGNLRSDYIRAQLQANLSDDWTVLLGFDRTVNHSFGQWSAPIKFLSFGAALIPAAELPLYSDPYRRGLTPNLAGPFNGKVTGYSGQITGTLGAVTVKSISAYRRTAKDYTDVDYDGSPYNVIGAHRGYSHQKQFSQEFQVFGKTLDDRLDWIAGAFYFKEDGDDYTVGLNGLPAVVPPTQLLGQTLAFATNKSIGAYAQLSYAITEQLRLTGGVRYTKDTRSADQRNARVRFGDLNTAVSCPVVGATIPTCSTILPPTTFDYFPFTVGLDYRPRNDVLFYAKFSRGYRSGGYSVRGNIAEVLRTPYRPERVSSYEVGFKLDLLDRHLRLNAAFYHAGYDDIQFSVNVPDPTGFQPGGVSSVSNAGRARINGAELEGTAILGPIRLTGNFSYTDPKYTKIDPLAAATGITLNSNFIFFSRYTYGLGADYTTDTGVGKFNLHADYNYKSKVYYGPVPPTDPAAFGPGYGLANAQASLELSNVPLTVSVFVRNLTDKKYINRGLVAAPLVIMGFPGDPRTYGISFKYDF